MKSSEWLRRTDKGRLYMRGTKLSRLDRALEAWDGIHSHDKYEELVRAFLDWAYGPHRKAEARFAAGAEYTRDTWRIDPRNHDGAAEELFDQLKVPFSTWGSGIDDPSIRKRMQAPGSEEDALVEYLQQQRDSLLRDAFRGQRITTRISHVMSFHEIAESTYRNITRSNIVTAAGTSASVVIAGVHAVNAIKNISLLVKESVTAAARAANMQAHEEAIASLVTAIAPEVVRGAMVNAIPVLGFVVGTGVLTVKAGLAAMRTKSFYDAKTSVFNARFRRRMTGGALCAIDAAALLIRDELHFNLKKILISDSSLLTRVGLFFVDGGAVSGPTIAFAEAMGSLILTAYMIAQEYKKAEEGSRLLVNPDFGFEVFEKCPLLGAYAVCCASPLALFNWNTPDVGRATADLARAMSEMDKLHELCKAHIKNSWFLIPQLRNHPGVLQQRVFHNTRVTISQGPRHLLEWFNCKWLTTAQDFGRVEPPAGPLLQTPVLQQAAADSPFEDDLL